VARRSKLTKQLIKEAAELLEAGNYAETVAACVGVSEATWYSWLKDAREGEKPSPLKTEFLDAIERATAEAEKKYVAVIEDASKQSWQAAAWWLERKLPKRWARTDKHKHEHKHDHGVMRVAAPLSTPEWEAIAREQQAVGIGGDGNGRPN
jgi:hypothetical protein